MLLAKRIGSLRMRVERARRQRDQCAEQRHVHRREEERHHAGAGSRARASGLRADRRHPHEKRAREERARYVAALVSAAATALRSRFERAVSALTGKAVRHA